MIKIKNLRITRPITGAFNNENVQYEIDYSALLSICKTKQDLINYIAGLETFRDIKTLEIENTLSELESKRYMNEIIRNKLWY